MRHSALGARATAVHALHRRSPQLQEARGLEWGVPGFPAPSSGAGGRQTSGVGWPVLCRGAVVPWMSPELVTWGHRLPSQPPGTVGSPRQHPGSGSMTVRC